MTKPLNENLIAVRVETEAGDLVPIKDATGFPEERRQAAVRVRNPATPQIVLKKGTPK